MEADYGSLLTELWVNGPRQRKIALCDTGFRETSRSKTPENGLTNCQDSKKSDVTKCRETSGAGPSARVLQLEDDELGEAQLPNVLALFPAAGGSVRFAGRSEGLDNEPTRGAWVDGMAIWRACVGAGSGEGVAVLSGWEKRLRGRPPSSAKSAPKTAMQGGSQFKCPLTFAARILRPNDAQLSRPSSG